PVPLDHDVLAPRTGGGEALHAVDVGAADVVGALQVAHQVVQHPRAVAEEPDSVDVVARVADLRDRVVLDGDVRACGPDAGVVGAVRDEALDDDVVRLGADTRHHGPAVAGVDDRCGRRTPDGDRQRLVQVVGEAHHVAGPRGGRVA